MPAASTKYGLHVGNMNLNTWGQNELDTYICMHNFAHVFFYTSLAIKNVLLIIGNIYTKCISQPTLGCHSFSSFLQN